VDINVTLLGQTIAMVFFVWFCVKYIWPFITNAIDARQKQIAEGLAAGERGRNDLAEAQTEAAKIIASARDKARGIVDQAQSRANDIVEQAKTDGETEKRRQVEGARTEIDVAMNQARDELRGQVAKIAVAAAEKVLAREIDAKAHRDLLGQLANEL
jgi:F-type H+-transporting ATPase subunit b